MKLSAGLLLPGLWLLLLPCCCRVQAEKPEAPPVPPSSNGTKEHAITPVPAATTGTNHTSAAPVVKPGTNITTGNSTQPPISSAVPSNTTTPTTPTTIKNITAATTTNITATTAATAKTSATKAPPIPSSSPSVTKITPKAPSSDSPTAETATAKAPANLSRSSGFDVGSFIGGIVLTLGILILGYIGCRTYHAKRGVQYRTIDEHDAII